MCLGGMTTFKTAVVASGTAGSASNDGDNTGTAATLDNATITGDGAVGETVV